MLCSAAAWQHADSPHAPRSFLAQNPADLLRPLGLNEDGRNFPLSPKSERAYTRISHEFDVLFQALQAENDVNQNMPVWPTLRRPS